MDEGRAACEQSLAPLGKLADTLHDDQTALHEAVAELEKGVEESAKQLSDDVTAAEAAMSELAGAVKDAAAQAHHALDAEAGALKGLAEHLTLIDAQVDILATAAVDASQTALERANSVADALGNALEDAEGYLSDFVAFLEEMKREVESAVVAAGSVTAHQCPKAMEEAAQDFAVKSGEIPVVLKTKFAELEKHAEEVAEYSLGQFREFVDEEKSSVEEKLQTVAIDLEELTRQAAQETSDIATAGGSLDADLRDNVKAAEDAEQALHRIRRRWALFGFGF
jgi:hypothetical protein